VSEKWMVLQPSDARYPYTLVSRTDVPANVLSNPSASSSALWLIDIDEDWPATSKLPKSRLGSLRLLGEVTVFY
jgi:hypothetical protein